MKTIILTGGGTAGHVMPNIYLLDDLRQHFERIVYVGRAQGIEHDIAERYHLEYCAIPAVKFDRKNLFKNLAIPFVLFRAKRQAKAILRRYSPALVFSKGGYVSLPVCMASRSLKIPTVTHESDYTIGLANKLILRHCDTMCVNFEHLTALSPKITYTGAIISPAFDRTHIQKTLDIPLDPARKTILIVGGSQGSQVINTAVFGALQSLSHYNIIHLIGKNNTPPPDISHPYYTALQYCDNMPYLYSLADLVIGRSGAGVVFECAHMGVPMLLIPLENKSSRGDQIQNAQYFASRGCATILRQSALSPDSLTSAISSAVFDIPKMKISLQNLHLNNGKNNVINIILKYSKK